MKSPFVYCLLGGLLTLAHCQTAFGQASDKMLFGGLAVGTGMGRYSPVDYGVGAHLRAQYPLTPKLALTAKVGLERYRISTYYLMPYSYLGYGYNPISGFGFNTLYVNYFGYDYKVTVLNIPVVLGPRLYLTNRVHIDLLAGVDIAPVRGAKPTVHLEPGVGYLLPFGKGHVLDINLGLFTDFAKGNKGILMAGAAYGLPWGRAR